MNKIMKTATTAALALFLHTNMALAFGAIAVDDDADTKPGQAGYGIGSGDSREEAAAAAIVQCKKSGNDSCKIVVRYDQCGAYASSNAKFGIGWGKSEATAKSKAMDDCGNDSCKIVVSDCS
jgi:hypothetical protein